MFNYRIERTVFARLYRWSMWIAMLLFAINPMSTLRAQTATGSITGAVTDPLGAAVVGAKVTLVNTSTNQERNERTNRLGYFSFPLLPPGHYRLVAEQAGFKQFIQEDIQLDVGIARTVNASLQMGDVAQTMTVNANQEVLESQTSSLSQVIGSKTIDNLPLNGRNSYSFATLVPGVIAQVGFSQAATDEYNDQFVSINGSRPNASLFLLDGGWNSEPSFNGPGVYPSVDLVQQYNVETNNLSAEFTNTAGGVVNVITKSGGNQFHGSAYDYYRTTGLTANNFFANQAGLPRAPFSFKQFGATLGGPIRKDKTFFFFSYEGLRWTQAITTVMTVPTAAQKQGVFSQSSPIYNPFTTRPDPANPGNFLRTQFAGNVIPAADIDPVAKALLDYFPNPTGLGNPGTGTNNFTSNTSAEIQKNDFSLRGDHSLTQNQKIFGRFTISDTTQPRPNLYGNTPQLILANPVYGNDFLRQAQAVADYTNVLRPNLVLELNSSYVYYILKRDPQGVGFNLTSLGFPQYFDSVTSQYTPCFPEINIAGMTSSVSLSNTGGGSTLGAPPCQNIHYRFNVYHQYGNLTFSKTAHTFKMGANFGQAMMAGRGFQIVQPNFSFFSNFTQGPDPINDTNSGQAFASFLLGTGSGNTGSGGPSQLLFHFRYYGFYFQDDWKVTPRLTLNLGMRYDYNRPLYQLSQGMANWDYNAVSPLQVPGLPQLTGGLVFPGSTISTNNLWNANQGNIAPRFGFAYHAFENTVLRGGFGLFTASIDGAGFNQYAMPSSGFQGSTPWVATLDGVTPLNTMANPFPTGFVLPTGSSLGLATQLGQSITAMDRNRPSSYAEQWNLDLQQVFPHDILFDVAYTGNHGIHLFADRFIDQLPDQYLSLGNQLLNQVPNPFYGKIASGPLSSPTVSMSQLLLPYPQFSNIILGNGSTYGMSSYNAMYLKVERRFANGFSVLGSFTWAKLMDNIPSTETGFPGGANEYDYFNAQNWNNLKAERSLATFDTPLALSISGLLELPFGHNKMFFNQSRIANWFIGGWQLNGISQFQSGNPLGVAVANNTLFNNNNTVQRANWNGQDPRMPGAISKKLNDYFNVNDFSAPPSFTYGNTSRTLKGVSSPGVTNFDVSAIKSFVVHDNWKAQFRAESFNLFNRPQFGPPDTTLGDGTTGVISLQNNLPREIQLAFRLDF
jgi:hypothetical protein